jgi:signal transduction histidine kinase
MLNVMENALKYSSSQKKPVEVKLERTVKGVEVAIRDHGEGIPKSEQGKVFEPFYRVDKSRTKATGGYGLGLSLCKEIMLAHGGDIKLKSSIGKGTEIRLLFPKAANNDGQR